MYIMHNNGIAIATNAICINKFLVNHDLPKKRAMTEKHVQMKIRVNGTDKIDNRTKKWTYYKIKKRTYAPRTAPTPGEELRELVWKMYVEDLKTAAEIASELGFSPPNIYYHLRKKYAEVKSKELDALDR
jgi:DNA-binding CsgD family transcriptional regulator